MKEVIDLFFKLIFTALRFTVHLFYYSNYQLNKNQYL